MWYCSASGFRFFQRRTPPPPPLPRPDVVLFCLWFFPKKNPTPSQHSLDNIVYFVPRTQDLSPKTSAGCVIVSSFFFSKNHNRRRKRTRPSSWTCGVFRSRVLPQNHNVVVECGIVLPPALYRKPKSPIEHLTFCMLYPSKSRTDHRMKSLSKTYFQDWLLVRQCIIGNHSNLPTVDVTGGHIYETPLLISFPSLRLDIIDPNLGGMCASLQ